MPTFVYVSEQDSDTIRVFRQRPDNGALELNEIFELEGGPSAMVANGEQTLLYVALRSLPGFACLAINRSSGRLSLKDRIHSRYDACHISLTRGEEFLLSAYYGGGQIAVHRILEDGRLDPDAVFTEKTAETAHCIQTTPDDRFAFVPHVRPNMILQFRFERKTGHLIPNEPKKAAAPSGQGPRHFCLHPEKDLLYTSNEQGSSLSVYKLDGERGLLEHIQILSTLPENYMGKNTCAQIHMTPDSRFLYVSNRGHDSIAGFAIDKDTGLLERVSITDTEAVPRAFNLDPGGNYLYAGGLDTGNLAAYRVEKGGNLEPLFSYGVGKKVMGILPLRMCGG